jgi:hypothetical protein
LPATKNVSNEAEDIVRICPQATNGKDIADWEDLVHAVVDCSVCMN